MAKLYTASHICRLVHDVDKITMHKRDFDKLLSDIEGKNKRIAELEAFIKEYAETLFEAK